MLLRVVRLLVVGAAVLLALHLFMLAGHGAAGHGSMALPGGVTHDAGAMDRELYPAVDLDAALPAGVDMAATCFAVLAALLLVRAGARGAYVGVLPAPAGVRGRPAGDRARPRARSPAELCVSRS